MDSNSKQSVLLTCLFGFILAILTTSEASSSEKILNVGLRNAWPENLHPATQHSLAGDAVMAYEFEPLLIRGNNGLIRGLAAKSFEFNKDFTVYTFKIDTSHRFSDGTRLQAKHFKESWEGGLLKEPSSTNPNQEDGLSQVVGFDEFKKTKTLSGLKVIGTDTLEVHFKKPFRLALVYFSGGRFAAYLEKDGKPIGTNMYKLDSLSPNILKYSRNEYYHDKSAGFDGVNIKLVSSHEDAMKALQDGTIDVLAFNTKILPQTPKLATTTTHESRSIVIDVNGIQGKFFAQRERRIAFQSLIWRILRSKKDLAEATQNMNFALDPQPYAQLQAGRISESEAESIISEGEEFIPELLKASQMAKLEFRFGGAFAFIAGDLKKAGLNFTNRTYSSPAEALDDFYKNFVFDASTKGASFYNSDPDGLYHVLGRHGAITSPVIQREKVANLMEEGRNIFGQDKIAEHYEKVTRAILTEVPYVHIGFGYDNHVYRTDRVGLVNAKYNELHSDPWNLFQPLSWYERFFTKIL